MSPGSETTQLTERETGKKDKCSNCGLPLSRYNPGSLCQSCISTGRKEPAEGPADLIINGRKLAELRRGRDMTQQLLADMIGVSVRIVEKMESRAGHRPKLSTLSTLAHVLKVPWSELLGEASAISSRALLDGTIPARDVNSYNRKDPGSPQKFSPAIAELCGVLTDYSFDPRRLCSVEADEIPSFPGLERDLKIAFSAYQQSQFTSAASRITTLLADAQLAVRECREGDRSKALGVLALSYHAAASVLTKSGDSDLALLASERGLNAAEVAEYPSVRGSLIRSVAFSMLSNGRLEPAMRLVEKGAAALRGETAKDDAALSVYGMLFLVGSMAAARFGDGSKTADYLAEAGEAARRLGRDANHFWTAFGPTNVAIHRVNTAVELGDIKAALSSGLSLNTDAVPAERRVRYLLDVARVHGVTGKRDDAIGMMLAAERIAPEQVRQHYLSRKVVANLIRSAPGKPTTELDKLARRVNAFGAA